jgi:hypothetical protein
MTDVPEPGYRLKLRRAKEHLDFIERQGARFIQDHLNASLPFQPKPENQWTVIRRGTVLPLSPMWGTYFGDVVHNTRAALDQLICALILRADPNESVEHAQFPIYDVEEKWMNDIERRHRVSDRRPMIDGVPEGIAAAIKELQPYKLKGSASKTAPLMLLLIASNADKHRAVHEAIPRVGSRDVHPGRVQIVPPGYFKVRQAKIAAPGTVMETGAEVGRVKVRMLQVPPPDAEVGVHVIAPMEIAFRLPGKTRITTHWDLWAMVSAAWNIVLQLEDIAGVHGLPSPGPDWMAPGTVRVVTRSPRG